MAELIIIIKKDERKWPATSKRTRITGYGEGVHSMTSEHWEARVKHVGRPRIEAAMRRDDLVVRTVEIEKAKKAKPSKGGKS